MGFHLLIGLYKLYSAKVRYESSSIRLAFFSFSYAQKHMTSTVFFVLVSSESDKDHKETSNGHFKQPQMCLNNHRLQKLSQ